MNRENRKKTERQKQSIKTKHKRKHKFFKKEVG
jgi:hypothetical protein